jgi:tRNA dimethylallyltransferase
VYRGLDIGTAKVTAAERERVVHHGLDLVEPDQPFSAADFRDHALAVLRHLASRGGIGLLVGGTGLWLRAVARGIDTDALPSDAAVRAAIETRLRDVGLARLVADLETRAPALAATVDLANPRRVVRALEIATLQGDTPRPAPLGYPAPVLWLGLDIADRDEHTRRIRARARQQFDDGLVEEARVLRDRFDPTLPAFSAIGYREAWSVLDGERTVDQAIADDARRNEQFAKRQRTWFRSEPGIAWLDAAGDPAAHALEASRRFLETV